MSCPEVRPPLSQKQRSKKVRYKISPFRDKLICKGTFFSHENFNKWNNTVDVMRIHCSQKLNLIK